MKDERPSNLTTPIPAARPSSTLVIGLGNPILGDDGVGWKVAEQVQAHLGAGSRDPLRCPPAEIETLSLGGLTLMERMLGYQRVVLIDAMETGQRPAGSVYVLPLDALPNPAAGHSASAHDTTLRSALQTARIMGLSVPESVKIVAIETKNVYAFCEELSPPVAAAVPEAVRIVMDLLKE